MSKRLEGGYLGARPSWSLAANPGIWAIEQVYARRVAGTWPIGTETDANFSSVSLLLNGNGANASTVIADRSTNGLTAVPSGNAQISTTQSRFGGSSLYFDGTGDFVTATSTTLSFGAAEDFTWEAWIYPTATGGYKCIFNNDSGFSTNPRFYLNGTTLVAYIDALDRVTHQTAVQTNAWQHVAMVRSSGVVRTYLNGVQSNNSYSYTAATTTNTLRIGSDTGANSQDFAGYIDDLRITKGIARYTASFTPPIAPHPIPVTDANFGAVSLLLHMNGANASTYFPDHSYNALAVTANGNAQISTAQSKFGGASVAFDGNGDYLAISGSTLAFNASDFTIEGWFYRAASNRIDTILRGDNGTIAAAGFDINFSAGNALRLATDNGATIIFSVASGTHNVQVGIWTHLAFTRSGNSWYIFVNGNQVATTTNSASVATPTNYRIGGNSFDATYSFNGYIDEFRVTKGIARYTAAFTPPTAAFPNA